MTGDIRHASKWACLKKDVLRVIDPHELYEALIVVVDPPRSTVRHQETILHVDKSRCCDVYVGGKVRVSEFMIFLDLQHCGSK